jgi:hypothetical protein
MKIKPIKAEDIVKSVDYTLTNEILKINARHVENFNEIVKNDRNIKSVQSKVLLLEAQHKDIEQDLCRHAGIDYQHYVENREKIKKLEEILSKGISIPPCELDVKTKACLYLIFCLVALQYIVIFYFK